MIAWLHPVVGVGIGKVPVNTGNASAAGDESELETLADCRGSTANRKEEDRRPQATDQ